MVITVNGTKTDYYYNGSILAGQKTGSTTLVFMYDNNGDTFGFIYGGKEYYYVKNLQNDVTAIADSAGKVIANYYYDSWGNITSITGNTTIANINPLRYRTYYYDSETNLYYLNSRYYSPDMCRFINSDGVIDNRGINNMNLFQYCGNNPIMNVDSNGNLFWQIALVGAIVAGIAVVLGGCSKSSSNTTSNTTPPPTTTTPPSTTKPSVPGPSTLTQEQNHFVSVIAGEAIGANTITQKAVAHTIMNRVKEPRDVWSNATSVTEVLIRAQYNAVNSPQYNLCMQYLNNRDGSNAEYESLIGAVIPIYCGEEADFTGGAHYIFNVNGSTELLRDLESQPNRYVQCGPIDGISNTKYRMYRCLW